MVSGLSGYCRPLALGPYRPLITDRYRDRDDRHRLGSPVQRPHPPMVPMPPTGNLSRSLIKELERGYTNHCGHVIPMWVQYLMAEDRSAEIIKLVDKFVHHVGAGGHGWEVRLAQKFGVVYAAMKMGIDAGLLPWPKSLPQKVATKSYRRARNAAKTDQERAAEGVGKLRKLIEADGRLVDASDRDQADQPINIPSKGIGVRFTKGARVKYGILDAAMTKIFAPNGRSALRRFSSTNSPPCSEARCVAAQMSVCDSASR